MNLGSLIEIIFIGYLVMGVLLWFVMIGAQQIRVHAGHAGPMGLWMSLFALGLLVSSWPFSPWKEVAKDIMTIRDGNAR